MEINATEPIAWLGGVLWWWYLVMLLFYFFNKTIKEKKREANELNMHEIELNLSKKFLFIFFLGREAKVKIKKRKSENKMKCNNILYARKYTPIQIYIQNNERERDESTIMIIVTEMHGKTFSHGTEYSGYRIILYPFSLAVCVCLFACVHMCASISIHLFLLFVCSFVAFILCFFFVHIQSAVIATLMVLLNC